MSRSFHECERPIRSRLDKRQSARNTPATLGRHADRVAARALAGWTVGVTADRRAGEQCELLQRAGATIVHAPAICTLPLGPDGALRAALASIIERPPDVVVLTTGIGVRTLFEV